MPRIFTMHRLRPSRRAMLAIAGALVAASACQRADLSAPAAREAPPPAAAAASPAAATSPVAADDAEVDIAHSASLAGVAEDADAEPADLADDRSYELPGPLHSAVTLEWLQQRFGKDNVRVQQLVGAEGMTAKGIVLFPDDPARRASVWMQDATRLRGISTLSVDANPSRWHHDNGVRIGMPLAELVARNGRPVSFYGFDWDYGGYVTDWHGGKLEPARDNPVGRGVRLGHADGAGARSYPQGDGEFRSDDKRWPRLGQVVQVAELVLSFPSEDDQ